jgi:hypothetical protein
MKIWFKTYRSPITGTKYRHKPDLRWKKYDDPFTMGGPFGTQTLGVKRRGKAPYSRVGLKLYSMEYSRAHKREVARRERGYGTLPIRREK